MRDGERHRASAGIGALTRRDRYREAALSRKVAEAYHDGATATSSFRRRRHLRAARRHERALMAQRRRPQSVLSALACALVVVLAALVWARASFTAVIVVAALLALDAQVLRVRRRRLRRS